MVKFISGNVDAKGDKNGYGILKDFPVNFVMMPNQRFTSFAFEDDISFQVSLIRNLKSQYLLNQISTMEYTIKLEDYYETKCKDDYKYDQIYDKEMLPLYIDAISSKYKDDYKRLVKELNKSELQRVYRLIKKINYSQAKKLNQAYVNRNK